MSAQKNEKELLKLRQGISIFSRFYHGVTGTFCGVADYLCHEGKTVTLRRSPAEKTGLEITVYGSQLAEEIIAHAVQGRCIVPLCNESEAPLFKALA